MGVKRLIAFFPLTAQSILSTPHSRTLFVFIHFTSEKMWGRLLVVYILFGREPVLGFGPPVATESRRRADSSLTGRRANTSFKLSIEDTADEDGATTSVVNKRRAFFSAVATSAASILAVPPYSRADEVRSTRDAQVTDTLYIDLRTPDGTTDRITVGLFGKDAPQPVSILKQLVSPSGYKSKCKPLDTSRLFEKEQLEANKVYNACIETETTVGVNYDYSQVWRVVKDDRIDLGSVTGKFIAREFPNFEDANSGLRHDAPGVVSVRRGNDGGFGFTIFPGGSKGALELDQENVVVGRVVEGMDAVERLNALPVVKSTIKASGGENKKAAPTRACRYGGKELYCNENKPLKKVLISSSGVL